ncbi:hypothetical protein CDLVIII_0031 [Clostridium sp. DL-VIII]|uniref:hypothetical protein n=1 Tax=Clostridium sp. DL-VIII TaxID=641107 RepID=UPI00023AF655|nr:hypothetical protein [Clostridium sp. DL-VIII]EHI96774.1 hypothetical protein CDLVIII_0031 [Clostridium sp. DL-VIII]
MYENWESLIKRFDFAEQCERHSDELYIIELSESGSLSINSCIKDQVKKNLLNCDSYITYSIDSSIPCKSNFLIKYNVLERAVDENNNIFIIVKSKTYDVEVKKEKDE